MLSIVHSSDSGVAIVYSAHERSHFFGSTCYLHGGHVAQSGLILDPEQAREDLAPYSRMAGGLANDALQEAGIDLGRRDAAVTPQGEVAPVIMLRCKKCQKLNEEDSKFCQECGAPI